MGWTTKGQGRPSDFAGPLVLEYLHPYHDQLVPDALWAGSILAQRRGVI